MATQSPTTTSRSAPSCRRRPSRPPRRPGALRRRVRRLQRHPLERAGRDGPSACPTSSPTACSRWRWPRAWSPTGSATRRGPRLRRPLHPAGSGARRRHRRRGRGRRPRSPRARRTDRVRVDLTATSRRAEGPRPRPGRRPALPDVSAAELEQRDVPLAELHHPAARAARPAGWSSRDDRRELVDAVRAADAAGEPLLVLGGGSNLVSRTRASTAWSCRSRPAAVEALAGRARAAPSRPARTGTPRRARGRGGLAGIEALSGIPGLVGATPIQNVGAYGQDVAQTITCGPRARPRHRRGRRHVDRRDCGFAYRHSGFKGTDRYVVLAVAFALEHSRDVGARSAMPSWPGALGVEVGRPRAARPTSGGGAGAAPRQGHGARPRRPRHVERGVVLHQPGPRPRDDVGRLLPADAPRWPDEPDGRVKTSAAWLIERAGFAKGYGAGPARGLSTKHTLALTNRGGATTADLLALAREIRDGVRDRFGVEPRARAGAPRSPSC